MADFVGCRTFDRRKIYGQIVDPTTPPPPPNQAPVAADDHSPADFVAHGHSNLTAQGNVIDGSSGGADIDADGDALIIVGVSAGSHAGQLNGNVGTVVEGTYGLLTINADGTCLCAEGVGSGYGGDQRQ